MHTHAHTQNTHAYTIYIMLSHNCARTPVVSAYIQRACTRYHTHTHYLEAYTLVHAQLRTHKYACVIYNSYGNNSTCPLYLWLCPPKCPPPPPTKIT